MTGPAERLLPAARAYVTQRAGWEEASVDLLAAGEYNVNFLVATGTDWLVLRLSTGTQEIDTGAAPILYEARALELLEPTGIAPRLVTVDPHPGSLPYGLLIEEYLPGRPLNYRSDDDLRRAAGTLAQLHAFRPAARHHLVEVDTPLGAGLEQGRGMLAVYHCWAGADPRVLAAFQRAERRMAALAERQAGVFPPSARGIVHTDVQAHNFIVGEQSVRLVDWEKPVWDDPSYDLCHFLARTTTRWKCGLDLSAQRRQLFLDAYCASRETAAPGSAQDLAERVRVRQPFVYWRALTWCAMALVEYRNPDRPLKNADTLARIEEYLVPEFVEELFDEALGAQ